jgi:hypothetical protein
MRMLFLVGLVAISGTTPLYAQDLATTCHATSSYDVTLRPDSLLFDRPSPAPTRVELQTDNLRADGIAVTLTPAEQDRLSVFERDLRALAPRVRQVALNGVDVAVQALRTEVAGLGLSADTRSQFDRKLASHAAELKHHIAHSQSTHDWDGNAMQRYVDQLTADLMPLVAADLGQQAISTAMNGDLQAAARLRDSAGALATGLQPRLEQGMQTLRPQIAALCPAVQRLARLQQGLRDSKGQPLNLVQVGADGTGESAAAPSD